MASTFRAKAMMVLVFRVQGLGFRVEGLGFGVALHVLRSWGLSKWVIHRPSATFSFITSPGPLSGSVGVCPAIPL